jgi:CRP-like cAMP-binding protein
MRTQRALLALLGCAALVIAAAQGVTGVSQLALYAAPFLLLLGLLLSGRFLGEEAILARRARTAAPRACRDVRETALPERPLATLLERGPRLGRGPPHGFAAVA